MKKNYNHQTVCKNNYRSYFLKLNVLILSLFFLLCENLNSQTLSAEQIYKKVNDAVVVILAYDYSDKLAAQGSGVVLNDKGYVVTNYHVLSGYKRLEIMHGKEIIPYVDIVGIDVEKDILILKIEEKKFPAVKLGDVKSLKVGQRIYAIGSPKGFENTISEGIISGLRSYGKLKKDYIQITASISPGSSGGAVVNNKGELIGISTLTVKDGQNLNFAIPINEVLNVKISSYSKNNTFNELDLFSKGLKASDKGKYSEAVKYYSRFIEKYPNDELAYNNRALSKRKLGDYKGALQDYNKAIKIDPNFAGAYFNRAGLESDLGKYRESIQDFNKAIKINPQDADAYNFRGSSKKNLEDYKGALQDYNKAIEINPQYADAYYNRSVLRKKLENYKGAIQDCNKAIEINPNFAAAYYNRGSVKSILDDYMGAISDYNKAILIYPSYVKAYFSRGFIKSSKLGDNLGGLQDYNKAIEINPNDAIVYYNRGVLKYRLGDKYGACLDWSKAGELGFYEAYKAIKENCN